MCITMAMTTTTLAMVTITITDQIGGQPSPFPSPGCSLTRSSPFVSACLIQAKLLL